MESEDAAGSLCGATKGAVDSQEGWILSERQWCPHFERLFYTQWAGSWLNVEGSIVLNPINSLSHPGKTFSETPVKKWGGDSPIHFQEVSQD